MNTQLLTLCVFVAVLMAIFVAQHRKNTTVLGRQSLSAPVATHKPLSWDWVNKRMKHPDVKALPLLPIMREFSDVLRDDPVLYMLFSEMLTEVPSKYKADPSGHPEVRDAETLIKLINHQLTIPPEWDMSPQIGTPLNAILDWPMGTKAGFAAFLHPKINQIIKKLLTHWAKFLNSSESLGTVVETDNGWLSPTAQKHSSGLKNFAEIYICEPHMPHWGFTSWDNFFVREFRPGVRPIASPDDDNVIVSACEARTFAIQKNVKFRDRFWIKGEPYSLVHMMNNDSRAEQFVGGTVYQAFLSADSYHRWHTPVSGTIVSIEHVPGTYFSEMPVAGFGFDGPDPAADVLSQGYISSVATRAVIFVQADNPKIGLMGIIMIGMAEVSSIEVTMPVGQHFKKGDQLGMFHFGGSSYCMIFGPDVKLTFKPNAFPSEKSEPLLLHTALATVS